MAIKLSSIRSERYRQQICVGQHEVYADARLNKASDSAPDPHDLYDSALGACKAMTLLMYAEKAEIPLEDIEIVIDRDASEERNGKYKLNVELRLIGNLTESQRQRLLAISEKCPVQKLMTQSETIVTTNLKAIES